MRDNRALMSPTVAPHARLRAALGELAGLLEEAAGGSATPVTAAIRRYLLPRLADPEAPLTVVVFGPTGAGKSTLVNSLAGKELSSSGPLRPTTRQPVVWAHQHGGDDGWMAALPSPVVVRDDHPLLHRLRLVDTPDLDSRLAEHRRLAEECLQVADAAVLVTSQARYADAIPWEVAGELARRRVPLLMVLNRVAPGSSGVAADLAALARRQGLPSARSQQVVTIPEQRLRNGLLPGAAVRRVQQQLREWGERHDETFRRSVAGTLGRVLEAAESGNGDGRLAAAVQAVELAAEELDAA